MRCKVPPVASKTGNVAKIVSTRPVPIINPLRNPIETISTRITITTEATKFHIKPLTAVFTISG